MTHSFPGSSGIIAPRRTVWVKCKMENNVGIGTNHREFVDKYCYWIFVLGVIGVDHGPDKMQTKLEWLA